MTDKPTQPSWWNDAIAWIDLHVRRSEGVDLLRAGDFSAVARIALADRAIYFKASYPPFSNEAALMQTLAQWFPDHIPAPIAIEPERGWMLLPDLGLTLRQITESDNDLTRWESMLVQFAHLQQQAAPHLSELLQLQVPDRRLAHLPELYAEAIAKRSLLLIDQDHEDSISSADYQAMMMFIPQLADLCKQLAELHIPETLHHDDFHANNIFVAENGEDYIFFDWAESCIAHPFYSLFMTLRYAHYVFHADPMTLTRLRDQYLAAWTQYAPLPRLIEAYDIAAHLAKLSRALTWHRAAAALPSRNRQDTSASATYWFSIFAKNTD